MLPKFKKKCRENQSRGDIRMIEVSRNKQVVVYCCVLLLTVLQSVCRSAEDVYDVVVWQIGFYHSSLFSLCSKK